MECSGNGCLMTLLNNKIELPLSTGVICLQTLILRKYEHCRRLCRLFSMTASNFREPEFARYLAALRKEFKSLKKNFSASLRESSSPLQLGASFPKQAFEEILSNKKPPKDTAIFLYAIVLGFQFKCKLYNHKEPDLFANRIAKISKNYLRASEELATAWFKINHDRPPPPASRRNFLSHRKANLNANSKAETAAKENTNFSDNSSQGCQGYDDSVSSSVPHFKSFPAETWERILRHLPFQKLAEIRVVCADFNALCVSILNSGFKRWSAVAEDVRQDKRSNRDLTLAFPLELCALDTASFSLACLRHAFGRYIECHRGCFYPGIILDHLEPVTAKPWNLSERELESSIDEFIVSLLDLSERAIRHLKEVIEPNLMKISYKHSSSLLE